MSRYLVNKLMWEVDTSDEALAAFKLDPAGFLDRWVDMGLEPEPPYPRGGALTGPERAALENLDFGAIYGMGANPFLLWQFARSVSVPEMGTQELITAFRESVEPHGYPDFTT